MIKAEVKFTLKHFQALSARRQTSWVWKVCVLFWIAVIAFFVASNISDNGFDWHTAKSLTFWIAVFAVVVWLRYMSSPQKQYKNYQKSFPNCTNTYCFQEDKLSIISVSDVSSSTGDYIYDLFESAEEKNGFFLIKIKGVGIVVISSDEIAEGTPEELRALLQDRLGKKCKIKN